MFCDNDFLIIITNCLMYKFLVQNNYFRWKFYMARIIIITAFRI